MIIGDLKESDFTYKILDHHYILDHLIFIYKITYFFIIIPITRYFVYVYKKKLILITYIKYTLQKQILRIMSTYIQNKKML